MNNQDSNNLNRDISDLLSRLDTMMFATFYHDTRNRLQTIKGYVETVISFLPDKNDQLQRRIIQDLKNHISECILHADSVMVLYKRGKFESLIDLRDVIKTVIRLTRHYANKKGVDISTKLPKDCVNIRGSDRLLVIALLSVVNNAIEAKSHFITITASYDDKIFTLNIRDDGIGISDKELERVFDPAYTTKVTGQGMGLSVAKRIIESHKGKLVINSKENDGTVAIFNFPIP